VRIKDVKGEFYFKALYKQYSEVGNFSWVLSSGYYPNKQDAEKDLHALHHEVLWPVEVDVDGWAMVPDPEELL